MEIVLILVIAIAVWLAVRRRSRRKQAAFLRDMFEGNFYRSSMDAILSSHDITLEGSAEQDQLAQEVITLAHWIGSQSVLRSPRDASNLDDDDRFVAMLITFVASDHLSRLANVSFEENSVLACLRLNHALGGGLVPDAIGELIQTHNTMAKDPNSAKTLQAIGTQVESFFASNNEESLNKLGQLFTLMRENLHHAA